LKKELKEDVKEILEYDTLNIKKKMTVVDLKDMNTNKNFYKKIFTFFDKNEKEIAS
jgi:hypothetical protein